MDHYTMDSVAATCPRIVQGRPRFLHSLKTYKMQMSGLLLGFSFQILLQKSFAGTHIELFPALKPPLFLIVQTWTESIPACLIPETYAQRYNWDVGPIQQKVSQALSLSGKQNSRTAESGLDNFFTSGLPARTHNNISSFEPFSLVSTASRNLPCFVLLLNPWSLGAVDTMSSQEGIV